MGQVKMGYADMLLVGTSLKTTMDNVSEAYEKFVEAIDLYSSNIQDDVAEEANKLALALKTIIRDAKDTITKMNEKLSIASDSIGKTESRNKTRIGEIR